eukprot:COSAG01_NODE_2607_length_7390_cov_77.965574_2_plen_146_part_00
MYLRGVCSYQAISRRNGRFQLAPCSHRPDLTCQGTAERPLAGGCCAVLTARRVSYSACDVGGGVWAVCATGITDIDAALLHEVVYTPDTWQQRYNCHRGAAFGLNHHFGQVPDARAAGASTLTEMCLRRACSYPGISAQPAFLSC